MWEKVSKDTDPNGMIETDRMKVPGGWIVRSVRTYSTIGGGGCSVHQLMVPDAEHSWQVKK